MSDPEPNTTAGALDGPRSLLLPQPLIPSFLWFKMRRGPCFFFSFFLTRRPVHTLHHEPVRPATRVPGPLKIDFLPQKEEELSDSFVSDAAGRCSAAQTLSRHSAGHGARKKRPPRSSRTWNTIGLSQVTSCQTFFPCPGTLRSFEVVLVRATR